MLQCMQRLRFHNCKFTFCKTITSSMASDVPVRKKPIVYVVSKIPGIHQCIRDAAPYGVIVKTMPNEGIQSNKDKECLPEEVSKFLKESEIVLCDPGVLVEIYDSLPNLQWAHSTWAGVENLVTAVNEKKITPKFLVTRHGGDAFASLMAEYVLSQVLSIEKNLSFYRKCQEEKFWPSEEDSRKLKNRSLNELVICTLGVGNMGLGVARLLKSVGCRVIGLSRYQRKSGAKEYIYFDEISTSFADVLSKCDYLCNTLPSTPRTRGLLNNQVLKMCKKAPVFINVGRGDVINEDSLCEALESNWLSHAVLDVFQVEPLPLSSALWKSKKVTITPHIAASSKASHVVEEFFKNYNCFIQEKELNNSVNWSAGY